MSTLRVSNIEAKADPSSPSVDEKLKVTNSNGDILVHIDGKTAGVTTIGINTTDRSFTVDAAQNVEFLGIVTATKFSLSGGGEITGGDGNFTGIVTSGSGNFTGGLSVGTAVTAATANFTSSLTAASANFTGNVSIAGTLTYEDVTNVDSVGIATARTGIDVTGGHIDLVDNSKIRVGTGDDLQIFHNGSSNYIDNTSDLYVRVNGSETAIYATANGKVALNYDSSNRFETTATGVEVSGATKTDTLEVTQEYPSIRPTLDLNFAATKTLDRRITFTRDGVGTYIDEHGLVKYASNNVPRFDHDPDTGESLGLLIEESRTNLFQDNNNPTNNSSGSASKSTVQIVLPSGETGPALETDANDFAKNYRNITATANTNPGYLTFYAKKKTSGTGTLTITMEGGGTSRSFHSGSINSETWTKISTTHNWSSSNSTGRRYDIYLQTANSSDSNTSFYVAFQQFEEDSFPTSYIPTSGSTVTRAADLPYIEGSNFSDFYDTTGSGGTFFVEFGGSNTSGTILSLGPDSGYTQTTQFGNSGYTQGLVSSNYNTYNTYGGTGAADAGWNTTGTNKFAFTITSSQVKLCGNGKSVKTGSGTTPIFTNFTKLTFGGNIVWDKTYTGQNKNHIRSIKYYRSLLSDSQLQGLTQQ